MRFLLSIIALGGTIAACGGAAPFVTTPTPSPQPAGEDAPIALGAIDLPAEIGAFRAMSRREYPNPADGAQIRFIGPRPLAADVYLYPIIPQALATTNASRDSAAMREFKVARDGIYTFQKQIRARPPRVVQERPMAAQAASDWITHGWHGTYRYRRENASVISHLYVFALHDRYVKVRASYEDRHGPEVAPAALDEFVRALVAAVAAGYEKPR